MTGAIPAGGEFPSAWGIPQTAWCEGTKASLLASGQANSGAELQQTPELPCHQAEATSHLKPHTHFPPFLPLHLQVYSEYSVVNQQTCGLNPISDPASRDPDPRRRSRVKFLEEKGEERGNDCCGKGTGEVLIPLIPSRQVTRRASG